MMGICINAQNVEKCIVIGNGSVRRSSLALAGQHGMYRSKRGGCGIMAKAEFDIEPLVQEIVSAVRSELKKPEWIPVDDRLPEEGVTVLITWNGKIDLGKYEEREWWWLAEAFCDYWKEAGDVVAWMPLPEPYKGD